MYKVGICGHFAVGKDVYDGQTIKTRTVKKGLSKFLCENQIAAVDTYNWKKKPIDLFYNCLKLNLLSENIIILPAHRGVKVFLPLFTVLNIFFRKKIHYIVIGGWIVEIIKKNKSLKMFMKNLEGIYVETTTMKNDLESFGFNNIYLLPNCKDLSILSVDKMNINLNLTTYRVCTFSRVIKEKGIEDAINCVRLINEKFGYTVFELDIFGEVSESYKSRFNDILDNAPSYISYGGAIDPTLSVDILKDYFVLLFPTHFMTEGIPGSIIDAYCAGIPVVSYYWNNVDDIIIEGKTGYICTTNTHEELAEKLIFLSRNCNQLYEIKLNCLEHAKLYSLDTVIGDFMKKL